MLSPIRDEEALASQVSGINALPAAVLAWCEVDARTAA